MGRRKKNTLSDALKSAADKPVSSTAKNSNKSYTNYANVKSRSGKRMIAGYFAPDIHRHLKILAAQNDVSLQDIVYEAISDYLKTHGYPGLQEDKQT